MSKLNLFNSVKLFKPKRNHFDLSHDVKMSAKFGLLYPTTVIPCVPGDSFNIGCESLIRFAPLVSPVMHRMNVYMHYFFVPNRLVWEKWEDYITNTKDGDGNLPAFPFVNMSNSNYSPLMDYMGLPDPGTADVKISALPFAMYNMIFNEYYRDQNLIPAYEDTCIDGSNDTWLNFELKRRAWMHDYFTAALPWAQKGEPVNIPLGETQDSQVYRNYSPLDNTNLSNLGTGGNVPVENDLTTSPNVDDDTLYVKGQELEPTTINDLRRAFRLQEWLERAARGGSRYTENILNFFGVKSQDSRLQRPEYITGTKSPVVISEVLNTTGTEDLPQGNMSGHGLSVTSGKYGKYYAQEHGYIIGIMSVMPETAYQQGVNRDWMKVNDPFEFYWPQFAHIGEQEVYNAEVFVEAASPLGTFGYVPRYAEYKFMQNRVAGDFKTTLDFWHLGRIFASEPALNGGFVQCDPSTRIFAVEDGTDYLYCHIYHKVHAARPMPKFGTPSF